MRIGKNMVYRSEINGHASNYNLCYFYFLFRDITLIQRSIGRKIDRNSLLSGLFLIFALIWGYNLGLKFDNHYKIEGGDQKDLLSYFNFIYFI